MSHTSPLTSSEPADDAEAGMTLEKLRRTFVMSQTQAAQRVGVSRSLWGAWEARRRRISLEHIQRIRRQFHLEDAVFQQLVDYYGDGGRPEQTRPLPSWKSVTP